MNERLLREVIRYILSEDSRTDAGDAAQKRIAAYLVEQGLAASVNKSGSQSADVVGTRTSQPIPPPGPGDEATPETPADMKPPTSGAQGVIESKNSEGGSHIYSQELTKGSPIAAALGFEGGEFSGGLSITRFRPAVNGEPLPLNTDEAVAEKSREALNQSLQLALANDTAEWQVLGGGTGPEGPDSAKMTKAAYGRASITWDKSIIQKDGRPVIIVVAPSIIQVNVKDENDKPVKDSKGKNQKKDARPTWSPTPDALSRAFFLSDGSAKLRPAQGGKGEETLGTFADPGPEALTKAWRKYYKGHDDYFAIVTGNSMYIGNIQGSDPISIAGNQLTVKLATQGGKTMSYGGANVTGLREKVMIEIVGGVDVGLPDDATAESYVKSGHITVRGG